MKLKDHTRFYQPAPIAEGSHVEQSGENEEESDTLAMAGGIKRRRIQPEYANEEAIVDVTTLYTPPFLPLSRASSHASFSKQNDDGNEDQYAPLEDCDESELALASWMEEVRGRIEISPPMRRTEDDVQSENFGPARRLELCLYTCIYRPTIN